MPAFDFVLAGRYRLVAPLGEGGMASVYRGRDLRLNRDVAVKILREDLTQDPHFLARFEREAQIVASLSHPNIVPVYDVGDEGGSHFIVMEYIPGRTLKELIVARRRLPDEEAVKILRSVVSALGYAHARALVHRDVKPHNILLSPDGTPKLADFGIAHVTGGSATSTAAILGSVHYLSPEQARGEEATPRSDIYASGIVLYEMVAGYPPFQGDNALAIANQHLHSPAPALPEEVASPVLESIVQRCLAKTPDDRFEDAAALERALQGADSQLERTAVVRRDDRVKNELITRADHGAQPAVSPTQRLDLRRSVRKSFLLAAALFAALIAAAYAARLSVQGYHLPHYPSTPYMLVPLALALVVLSRWMNARSWKYSIDGNTAVVQWGLLSHHRFGLSLRSVSTLELQQSLLDRVLGVGTVELRARDAHGEERRVVMEDLASPRQAYDELRRLLGQSIQEGRLELESPPTP